MDAKEKEAWRYRFAGQIYAAMLSYPDASATLLVGKAVRSADDLIHVLEKTGPKECEHEWWHDSHPDESGVNSCSRCGKIKI